MDSRFSGGPTKQSVLPKRESLQVPQIVQLHSTTHQGNSSKFRNWFPCLNYGRGSTVLGPTQAKTRPHGLTGQGLGDQPESQHGAPFGSPFSFPGRETHKNGDAHIASTVRIPSKSRHAFFSCKYPPGGSMHSPFTSRRAASTYRVPDGPQVCQNQKLGEITATSTSLRLPTPENGAGSRGRQRLKSQPKKRLGR